MGEQDKTTRRQFLKTCARGAGVVAAGSVAAGLIGRADADKVWQLDPKTCTTCKDFLNPDGWGRCATECVRKQSAVRAVNDFTICGYCFICPAYFDVSSEVYTWEEAEEVGPYPDGTSREDTYKGLICPQDAMTRHVIGEQDPTDPNNNFYEYTIDETKCNGCGLCVKNCGRPMGNESIRLEVRHHLCLDCNQCAIATNCPPSAFYRGSVRTARPGYGPEGPTAKGTHS